MNARHAYVDDLLGMPSEERIVRTLDNTLPAEIPPLPLGAINNVTRARIRHAFAELAHGNMQHVERWLHEVAQTSPAKAVELFIELAQFSAPKLKAVAVDVTSKDGSVERLSIAELQSIVAEQ